ARRLAPDALHGAVRGDVVRDVAVDSEALSLGGRIPGREPRLARLVELPSPGAEVQRPARAGHFVARQGCFGRRVLAEVEVVALALDHQRFHRENAVPA